ncbi:MAG TPA: hypothetical protein VFP61_14250 [Acidimicrobiales bacterium]|nr:hypothetical protein [Acidimicrobiales bacterium]
MRKLAALVVLGVLVGLYLVADVVVRGRAESVVASRIEANVPGTTATVHIHSFPFTGRLAVSGSVPSLRAVVTGVRAGPFAVQSIDLDVEHLVVDRSKLLQGDVVPTAIGSATVTAVVTQAAIDAGIGLPVTLGDGTIGVAGVQVPARVAVTGGSITIAVAGLRTISLPLLPAALLPCSLTGRVQVGQLLLSCSAAAIPPALLHAVAGAAG